jgi:SAM-dependent methyltransferase
VTSRAASVEPHPYRDFERAGWQSAAVRYPSSFARATAAYADAVLDAVGAGPGTRLLDIACGTGVVAGAAIGRGSTVTGVDFSAAMLAEARRHVPGAAFREGDAEALPLASASFDAAVSNFGLHHFPFPARALAEARRVLRPGARVAATVWAPPDDNIAWKLVLDAIAAHGDPAIALPSAPLGRLDRAEMCVRLLVEAGFGADAIAVRVVQAHWRLASATDLIDGFLAGTVRMAALITAQPPAARSTIRAAVAASVGAFHCDGGYAVPTAAILVSAPAGRS